MNAAKQIITLALLIAFCGMPLGAFAKTVEFPPAIATVEESFQGKGEGTVYLVRDAHASLEAQRNIANIINQLVSSADVKTVLKEGSEGPSRIEKFFPINNEDIKKKTAQHLMGQLRLSGSSYAYLFRDKDFELVGAEDITLYDQNLDAYRKAAEVRPLIGRELDIIERELNNVGARIYPRDFKRWLKQRDRYLNEKLEMLEYLKRSIDVYLEKGEMADLEKLTPNIVLMINYANGEAGEEALETLEALDHVTLFAEIDALEEAIAEKYLDTKEKRDAFHYTSVLDTLKKVAALKLTNDEYGYYSSRIKDLTTRDFVEVIKPFSRRPVVISSVWESLIGYSKEFYRLALLRDEVFIEKIKAADKPVVFIAGGFHTKGLTDSLKKADISYVVISPVMTSIDPNSVHLYEMIMSGRVEGLTANSSKV